MKAAREKMAKAASAAKQKIGSPAGTFGFIMSSLKPTRPSLPLTCAQVESRNMQQHCHRKGNCTQIQIAIHPVTSTFTMESPGRILSFGCFSFHLVQVIPSVRLRL